MNNATTLKEQYVLKSLEGVKTLEVEKITTTVIGNKRLNEVVEPISIDLKEISPEEIDVFRSKGISSFVLKVEGKFYYASIPNNINFIGSTILGSHRCSTAGHECHRLSAASDEDGGCEKVRDSQKKIEVYHWITKGYQTFNTKHDFLKVVECSHYVPSAPRKKIPIEVINRAKLYLAQFILGDDVTSREDVRKRVEANQKRNLEKL